MMIPHSFEVWVCAPPPHPCAADSDPVCFTYSEIDGVFVPWGFKSTLQFEFATDHYVASNRNANFQIAEHLDVLDKKKQKKDYSPPSVWAGQKGGLDETRKSKNYIEI